VFGRRGQHSAGVDWPTISAADAEVVLVAPCGFRLDGAARFAADVVRRGVLPPGAEVWAVDADAVVVRPGPRVVDGVELFASILHPDRVGHPDPRGATRVV
jgi:iron complex transport system substrate-binding protein